MPEIKRIDLRALRVPITVPYKSALGTLHHLDALFAQVWLSDGSQGFGEAVVVNGYTKENHSDSWNFLCTCAPQLTGQDHERALAALNASVHDYAHAVTCLASAVEMAAGCDALAPVSEERTIGLIAPLYSESIPALHAEMDTLIEQGYRTLKMKVGMEVGSDLQRVRAAQDWLQERAVLRLDANQGYSLADALRFASGLDPTGVELFEQPCAMSDWDAAVSVRARLGVPMMLDESITDICSIDRTAHLGAANLIKLKLVKTGGVKHLARSVGHARGLGLGVVLGNGVATEIGNWMEACVSAGRVDLAGEMNGFMKADRRLFQNPLEVRAGSLHIPPDYWPVLDQSALDSCTLASSQH